ncbi:TonB-dependent receptor [Caldimonas sp. KR1-144]|uniref:TonB-dependent receptor n=1 Tax=Caldimonas sp. KR1-144 TaxID=3400911 RepID=UPI003C2C467B
MKVFSSKTLENAGVTQIQDFIGLTPNASIVKSQSAGISFITIRGLSQVRNGEAPVAMVVDGVAVPNSRSFTLELSDLQDVQMLRGPQGAIYGRNAPGGAMVINTRQPTNETTGFFQAGAGTGREYSLKGAVSGAIVPDTLVYRIGGSFVDRKGYFDNVNLDEKMDPYRDATVRGLLRWYATDAATVDLRAMRVHTTGGANNFLAQNILYTPAGSCTLDPNTAFNGPAPDPNRYSERFCNSYIGTNDRDITDVSLKFDYAMPFATLTAIASYNTVEEFESGTQYPYTATPNLFGFLNGSQSQYSDDVSRSLEVRLASPEKPGLRWMAGMQILRTKGFISTATGRDDGQGIVRIERDPRFGATNNPTLSWLADTNRDRATSVFGNLEYDLTPKLVGAIGIRYDKDKRSQDVDPRTSPAIDTCNTGTNPGSSADCHKSKDFSSTQPSASLRYKISDETQVYATAGKGFRSGLFNQSGVAEAAGLPGVYDQVGPETTKSFEVGFKGEYDRRLRVEASLFRSKVNGQHYFLFIPSISAQVLTNIDEVTLTGGELEVAYTPMRGLDLSAGVGVTKSEINRYTLNPAAEGNWAPYVPRVSANLAAQYRFPIGKGLAIMTRGDVISKGKQYWDPENNGARDRVNLVNLHLGVEDEQGTWSLKGSVYNATDKKYNEEFVAGGFATPANPRVFRVEYRYKF